MRVFLQLGMAAAIFGLLGADAALPAAAIPDSPPQPAISVDSASYDIGLAIGNQLALSGLANSLSRQALLRGLDEALGGKRMSVEQRETAQQFSRAARAQLVKRNEASAREFLAKNAVEKNVITLPSGLQYRVLKAGDPKAPHPGPLDQVSLRYRASLADGTLLDSSDEHSQAATFRMNSMIKGWHEALTAMQPGAKWTVFVPPELAYGTNPPSPIPPGSLIIYELELMGIEATSQQMPQQLMRTPVLKAPAP